jgi:hypothetical protein
MVKPDVEQDAATHVAYRQTRGPGRMADFVIVLVPAEIAMDVSLDETETTLSGMMVLVAVALEKQLSFCAE